MTDFYHNHESTRVDSLIPQQLREGSAELVKFLSEYYIGENDIAISAQDSTYIDVASSLIQNLAKNRDLDRVTQTQFIEELAFEVAKNIPTSNVVTRKFLIKRLVNYYEVRGNKKMLNAFFRLFFNKEVKLFEPWNQVLIPSSGDFRTSEFVRLYSTTGNDPLTLDGKTIRQVDAAGRVIAKGFVSAVSKKTYDEEIFTLELEPGSIEGNFDTILDVKDIDGNVYGKIYRTLSSFNIVRGGTGYEVGDQFFLAGFSNASFLGEVAGVNTGGVISKVKILDYGAGNSTNQTTDYFTKDFERVQRLSDGTTLVTDRTASDDTLFGNEFLKTTVRGAAFATRIDSDNCPSNNNPNHTVSYFGFDESSNPNYLFEDYLNNGLSDPSIEASVPFLVSTSNSGILRPRLTFNSTNGVNAEFSFNFANLIESDGEYIDERGRLSADIVLQDSNFYQKFSYELQLDIPLSDYRDFYEELLHPAGEKLFNNLVKNIDSDEIERSLNVGYGISRLDTVGIAPNAEIITIPHRVCVNNVGSDLSSSPSEITQYVQRPIASDDNRVYFFEDYLEPTIVTTG